MNHQPFFQHGDKGQEKLAVEAVLVEIIGMAVGCRHDRHACSEKLFEKPPDDHRIGDIADLHLVEGEESDLFRQCHGHRRDGIIHPPRPRLAHLGMDPLHERVKMLAPLGRIDDGKEQVHQHRLAAPDPAPEIEADHRLGRFGEPAALDRLREALAHTLKFGQGGKLRRIRDDPPRIDTRLIRFLNAHAPT